MRRCRWAGRVAAVVVLAGTVPAAAPAAGVRDGEVFTFRTAGQPDRRVRVVRVTDFANGGGLADVTDLDSGSTYSVPVRALLRTRASVAPASLAAADRDGRLAPPPVRVVSPAVMKPAEPPAVPVRPQPQLTRGEAVATAPPRPGIFGRLVGRKELPPPSAIPQDHPAPAVVSADPPRPIPASATASARPLPAPIRLEPDADRQLPTAVSAAADVVVPPPTPPAVSSGVITPATVTLPELPRPVTPPTLTPVPTALQPDEAWHGRSPSAHPSGTSARLADAPAGFPALVASDLLTKDDVAPLVAELRSATRPSHREMAASGLADGRYGSRPEVKALLAQAAATDPAPSVQAHCVRCLAALGHADRAHVAFLRSCGSHPVPELQTAAAAALARPAPRD